MEDLSRALGYCRVSTQRQHTEGHGLERYIDQLVKYGLKQEQIYWDIESGSNEKRIGYNKVLELVRTGTINKIIVPCFDRFTRSALGWEVARQELQDFGVDLIFIDGGSLDLETPEGIFTSRILAAMSAQTRDKNRYNSIQGHRFFQQKRKIYQAVFGLIKDGDTVKPNLNLYKDTNKTYKDVAIEMIDMFLQTGNMALVVNTFCETYGYERNPVKYLDFPRAPCSLKRWLENPLLCGMIRYYAEEKEKTLILSSDHEGIISEDKFNEIAALLAKNPRGRKYDEENPLVSICYCSVCGEKMRKVRMVKKNNKKNKQWVNHYLKCTGAKPRPGKLPVCSTEKFFKYDEALTAVIEALKTRALSITADLEKNNDAPPQDSEEILSLKQEIFRLKSLRDSDYEPVIIKKEQRLETLLRNSETEVITASYNHKKYANVLSKKAFWKKVTRQELTVLFQDLVDAVFCITDEAGKQSFSVKLKP